MAGVDEAKLFGLPSQRVVEVVHMGTWNAEDRVDAIQDERLGDDFAGGQSGHAWCFLMRLSFIIQSSAAPAVSRS
jgi:hypothetical protein